MIGLLVQLAWADPPVDRVAEYNAGRSTIASADPDAVYVGAVPGTCGPLPNAMPAGFEVQWKQGVIPHGKMPTEYVVGFTSTRCRIVKALLFLDDPPTIDCRVLPTAELDQLWREIRPLYADGFQVDPWQASPHVGWRTLIVRWDGGSCEVHENSDYKVVDQDRFDAIRAVVIRASAPPR